MNILSLRMTSSIYKEDQTDFPSFSDINFLLEQKQTKVVFGVSAAVDGYYKTLVSTRTGSSNPVGSFPVRYK